MDILEEIIAHKRQELSRMKERRSIKELARQYDTLIQSGQIQGLGSSFSSSLRTGSGIIAEFKRKSPSLGWINKEAKVEEVTLAYQKAGASAISILSDSEFFGGSDEFIQRARKAGVTAPILYKNFIVDEYQLFQARLCGASAVLLIAAVLSKAECKELLGKAHELGLEVLLEMHDRPQTEYAELEPDACGINNRNLGSFLTDVRNSFTLAEFLPPESVKVSESGISKAHTIKELRKVGFEGFLIGGSFMKSADPAEELSRFIAEL